jgi:hypothetical protein
LTTLDEAIRPRQRLLDGPHGLDLDEEHKAWQKKMAPQIQAGAITINDHLYTHGLAETPWGGFKESGLGRTHSALGLEEMTQPQVVNWDIMSPPRNLWWFPFSPETYAALKSALIFSAPRGPLSWIKASLHLAVFSVKKMFSKWE